MLLPLPLPLPLPLLLAFVVPVQMPPATFALRSPAADTAGLVAPTPDTVVQPAPRRPLRLPSWLQTSAQLRTRAEAVSHYQLAAGPAQRDVYALTRLIVGGRITTRYVAAELSARHAVSHSRELPGARPPSDEDQLDLDAATVTLRCCAPTSATGAPAPTLALRVGRQPLSLGRERLLGAADWGNARRTFDAVQLGGAAGRLTAELSYARPLAIRARALNRADSMVTLTSATLGAADQRWQLYALDYRQERAGGEHRRLTTGGRVQQPATPGTLGYELEGAWQTGRLDRRRVAAWFVASEITAALGGAWMSQLGIGFDAGSGDADPDDARVGSFHVPFATGHAHGGIADVVGRPNTVEARIAGTVTPRPRLQLRATAYRFTRLRTTDGAHSKGGTLLRAAAPGSRAIGTEADLTFAYRVAGSVRLTGGIAHFAPGRFLRESASGARAVRWGFLATSYDF